MSTNAPSSNRPPLGIFPPPIVIPPISSSHTLTIIFLHGRGSNALKFHSPLLSNPIYTSSSLTFQQALPTARFVFPTAPLARASKYRRSVIHQWYEGTGDWEPQSRGDMRPSVEHIRGILRDETQRLNGDASRVVLAGISQGCAMALMSLLLWEGEALGAVAVMCGYLPLASLMLSTLEGTAQDGDDGVVFATESDDGHEDTQTPLQQALDELREEAEVEPAASPETFPFLSTPVFMGHGTQDEKVEYRHGQQAGEVLERMGLSVEFHRYEGLGHWYSVEMLGDIVEFLKQKMDL